jgi:germination protein YpeB
MVKKKYILLSSYITALIIILSGFVYKGYSSAEYYRRYIEAGWQRSFSDLNSTVSEIDSALQKGIYSGSPALLGSACAEVYAKCLKAQQSLGELPFSDYVLENTTGFIAKLGDYSRVMAKAAYSGVLSEDNMTSLSSLADAASLLSQNLNQLQADMDGGLLSLGKLTAFSSKLESTALPTLGGSFSSMEGEFPDMPALIYDGPYSQSIKEGKPKHLEGLEQFDEKAALKAVSDFTGLNGSIFKMKGKYDGDLPMYMFSGAVDGGEMTLLVSVQGGKVIDMSSSRSPGSAQLDSEEAIKKAKSFLEEKGYAPMKESYWTRYDNVMLINFAYTENNIICYPDLVKVEVALDNGDVIGFESTGYIMNHIKRSVPLPSVTAEEAKTKVSPKLKILSEGLAVIPTEGKNEVFCYEFKCEDEDGTHYIVYVNAVTGQEEKLLILIEDENGTLTM